MAHAKKQHFLIGIGLVLLVFAFWLSVFGDKPEQKNNQDNSNIQLSESINGELIEEELASRRPLAVMVENHPDSRPQSGLADAEIVYETVTEGGITRFLALYQEASGNIGPVRSARDYFAEIADEWGALYAHVGGSNQVIEQLKNGEYKNLDDANEYYNENFFERAEDKQPPHNVYTTTEKLRDLIDFYEFENLASYQPFQFKEDSPQLAVVNTENEALLTAGKINIDFSLPSYLVSYEYNLDGNGYNRFVAGEPHVDAETEEQIKVKNIVVQFVEITPWPNDPLLRVNVNLQSEGRALVFRDGQAIEGWWKKDLDGKMKYFDLQEQEIKFNRGPIWIELVPENKQDKFKWEELKININK